MDYENGVDELRSYFFESFKDTSKVIEHNYNFFNSLNNIREIYIFGHSMSEIDLPYFIEIKNKLTAPCFWCISYFKTEKMSPGEVEDQYLEAKQALLNIGIPDKHIKTITLNELAKNHVLWFAFLLFKNCLFLYTHSLPLFINYHSFYLFPLMLSI